MKSHTRKVLFTLVRNENKIQSYVLDILPDLNVNSFIEPRYDVLEIEGINGALVLCGNDKEHRLSQTDFSVALYGEAGHGVRFYDVININIPIIRLFEIVATSEVHNVYEYDIINILYEYNDGAVLAVCDGSIDFYAPRDYENLKNLSGEGGCYRSTVPSTNTH